MKKWPIAMQILFLIVVIIIIVSAVVLLAYQDMFRNIEKNSEENLTQLLDQQRLVLEDRVSVLQGILHNIAYTEITQEYLASDDMERRIKSGTQTRSLCQSMSRLHREVMSISIFTSDGVITGSESDFIGELSKNSERVSCSPLISVFFNGRYQKAILLVEKIHYMGMLPDNSTKQGTPIGWVVMYIDPANFPLSSYDSGLEIVLTDSEQMILAGNRTTKGDASPSEFKGLQPGFSHIVQRLDSKSVALGTKVAGLNGTLYIAENVDTMLGDVMATRRKLIWLLAAALAAVAIPFLLVMFGNLSLPLSKFARYLRSLHSGIPQNLSRRIDIQGFAELNAVVHEFNDMMDAMNTLTDKEVNARTMLIEAHLAEKQAQFELLQSQINPHFLYNTLETIKGVSLVNNDTQAFEIAEALGIILGYGIKGNDIVPFSRELEIARLYMSIQGYRFLNRFDMQYEIEDAILDTMIPRMLLQPLLENAITHGIEPLLRKGNMRLSASAEPEGLRIAVSDDGIGMDPDSLDQLRMEMQRVERRDGPPHKMGIGLINVHERLVLLYGPRCGLVIDSELGKGFQASFTLPRI